MSDAQEYLLAIDKNQQEAAHIAKEVANRIERKETKLVEVVQSVGEYLTDDDATIRAKAVAYLGAVLGSLDAKALTRQHVAVTRQFFCDRIDDATGLKESAQGLVALQRSSHFSAEDAAQVAIALFAGAQDLQQHPQGTRFIVLTLLSNLMSDYREALKKIGHSFIVGITDLVSGEKDPRNLMVIFSMLKVVMVEWDISTYIEPMFESVFCYFPITFRPPPGDPYGITAQDLKDRLRECIASSTYFAPHAFPALIDKLDSTSVNVKKDVLQAITACALNYEPATIASYSITLWDSMKFETLNAQEEDLSREALTAIQAIAVKLSETVTDEGRELPLSNYLRPITNECEEFLREPQAKQAKQAGQVIRSISSASPSAFNYTIKACLDPLLTMYQDQDTIIKRRALLEVVNEILRSGLTVYGISGSKAPEGLPESSLKYFQDRLFEVYSQALMGTPKEEVSFRTVALAGLICMSKIHHFLVDNEIGMVVQYLDEIVLLEDSLGRDEIKGHAIDGLLELSSVKSDIIMNITFPAFMARLPDSDEGEETYLPTLEGLAKLSEGNEVFEVLLRRLLGKLETVIKANTSSAYPVAILSAILYALEQRDLEKDPNLEMYFDRIVVGLGKRVEEAEESSVIVVDSVLEIIGSLTNVIIRTFSEPRQQEMFSQIRVFIPDFRAFEPPSRPRHSTAILFTYILAGTRPSISLPYDRNALFRNILFNACNPNIVSIQTPYLQQVTLLVNKWFSPQESHIIEAYKIEQLGRLNASPSDLGLQIRPLFHIAAALLLRTDKQAFSLITDLFDLLKTNGPEIAPYFEILLSPGPLLTKQNFCIVRLLHKQRLLTHILPLLSSAIQELSATSPDLPALRTSYLVALAGILKGVPSSVILPHAEILMPLLQQSIDVPVPNVKEASVVTLAVIISENSATGEGHLSSLITRLLNILIIQDANNAPRIRYSALRCLQIFPKAFRAELLLPFRKKVIRTLMKVLDDPKRTVRKEAVDCRTLWLGLDEPEEN
ncbi:MAG: hypothetical protein M1824_004886 [Vezdaea acicularis]|nr:MAG: hypothetical protein M1824_004886 [Vezdaea acicularis]